MEFKDYYKILGVPEDADSKTIKTAYRKLARKYHPDINKDAGAEDHFKEVAEAYEVLKNTDKRAEYDQLKKYGGQAGQSFEPPPGWQSRRSEYSNGAGDNRDFSDFFESMFRGASQQRNTQRRGQDVETELPIFLEDTLSDQPKTLSLDMPFIDEQGVRRSHRKTLNVKIPKGVLDGERIRLKGQGADGIGGGAKGDLYLTIKLVPHPVFDVDGKDLEIVVPVYPFEAALGAKVMLPTLEGKIQLSIPVQTQSGTKLRIKGKGLVHKKGRGDLFAIIKVVMPKTMTKEAKALWQEMAEINTENPRSQWEKH